MSIPGNVFYNSIQETIINNDIVNQSIDRFYTYSKQPPIANHKGIPANNDAIPKSYLDSGTRIDNLLNPVGLSSGGTARMLINSFNNYTCGCYLQVKSDKKENDLVCDIVHTKLAQGVKVADTWGSCLFYKTDTKIESAPSTYFYYNEERNIIYIAKNVIVNGQDDVKYETRQIKGKKLRVEIQYQNSSEKIKVQNRVPFSGEGIEQLGCFILYRSEWDDDTTGISVLDSVVESLKAFEIMQHYSNQSILFSKPRLHIPNEMVEYDEMGEPLIDLSGIDVYTPTDASGQDSNDSLIPVQFDIPSDDFGRKKDDDLELILSKVGLGNIVLAKGSVAAEKTAKEVISESSNMFTTIEMRRINYSPQLKKLVAFIFPKERIRISFLPLDFMDYHTTAVTVSTLKAVNLISNEVAVPLMYPRMIGTRDLQEEIDRLNETDKEKRQLEVNKQQEKVDNTQNSEDGGATKTEEN